MSRRKGCHRDREIVNTIEECGALNTNQVAVLFFSSIKHGRRKTQDRLLKLYRDKKKLGRFELEDGTYAYYTDKKPPMLEHLLGINWIRIWTQVYCKSWEQMHSFTYEAKYKDLRADAFASIKNRETGKFRFIFYEMDRGHNTFDKIPKYNQMYQNDSYINRWWVRLAERFPPIIIVTTTPKRAKNIETYVREQNKAGLEFKVKLLDSVISEVYEQSSKILTKKIEWSLPLSS